jgi:hypothetical protein
VQRDGDDLGIDAADIDRIRRIMSELDESDFERRDPPEEVWDGIEASISSQLARQPPFRAKPSLMVVGYRIDGSDVVTRVEEGWAEFARDNGAPELADPPFDRTLWSYIDRAEIRELWQLLVQRVRSLQKEARVPFRCDAPHAKRWFEMTIAPEADGGVQFRSVLVFEESRSPVALLDPHIERAADAPTVALCSWCGRGQHGAHWLDVEELLQAGRLLERTSMPPISYGICSACRDEMAAELLVPDTDALA